MISPRGLDINTRDKEIYVADRVRNMLFTYYAPHIFGE